MEASQTIWTCALVVLGTCSAAAQEPAAGAGLRRQAAYTGLWPFYSEEAFEDGARKWTSLFGAVRVETEPDGDWHHHVLPFYCASLWDGRTDRQLALFPLLYLRRRSPEKSYDAVLPFFSNWESGEARHTLLWPLFHLARNPEQGPFRWIPTLLRHGSWDEEGENRQRFGVPLLLELFERSSGRDHDAWTFANFFNFSRETQLGLPVAKARFSADGHHVHLFPLFITGRRGERSYHHTLLAGTWTGMDGRRGVVIPPLLTLGVWDKEGHDVHLFLSLGRFKDNARGHVERLLPFYAAGADHDSGERYRFFSLLYGTVESGAGETIDRYFPLLLSHQGRSPRGSQLDVLWPLGHYSEREDGGQAFALRALPFFDRKRSANGDWMGVGGILYRRHESFRDDSLSQWVLWPLGHWRTSPQGSLAWALPFYFRRNEETESGRTRDLFIAPSFCSQASERRWKSTEGDFEQVEREVHFWPFFGRGSAVQTQARAGGGEGLRWEERTWSTLYPFFQLERSTQGAGAGGGVRTSFDAPWPLVNYGWEPGSFDLRAFPALYLGAGAQRTYLYLLYPLLSVEDGPGAEEEFFHFTSVFQWYGGDDEQRFRVFPLLFHWRQRSDRFTSIAGPLYLFYYRALPSEGWFHLLPLGFGQWSESSSGFGVFPLYLQRDSGAQAIDYWSPARFFFLWNTLSGGEESHWSLLWKLMESTSTRDGDHDFRILHRLFLSRRVKGQRELLVNPLFQCFSDEQTGERSWSILKFLFRSRTEGGKTTASILFIPVWKN